MKKIHNNKDVELERPSLSLDRDPEYSELEEHFPCLGIAATDYMASHLVVQPAESFSIWQFEVCICFGWLLFVSLPYSAQLTLVHFSSGSDRQALGWACLRMPGQLFDITSRILVCFLLPWSWLSRILALQLAGTSQTLFGQARLPSHIPLVVNNLLICIFLFVI